MLVDELVIIVIDVFIESVLNLIEMYFCTAVKWQFNAIVCLKADINKYNSESEKFSDNIMHAIYFKKKFKSFKVFIFLK